MGTARMKMAVAILLLFWLHFPAGAEPPVSGVDVAFEEVRWQPLPRGIEQVYVGPDGRSWYQRSSRFPRLSFAETKEMIAREFVKSSPQINGVRLALFEPDGRVWFYTQHDRMLLAYDGREWLERRPASPDAYIHGACLTQGRLLNGNENRYLRDTAWFVGARGIYRFQGELWDYHQIIEGPREYTDSILLAVSPDAKTAAACRSRSDSIWVFRQEQWSQRRLLPEGSNAFVTHLALSDAHTLWYVLHPGDLKRLEIEKKAVPAEHFTALVRDLGAERFQVREDATAQLLKLGPPVSPLVERLLDDAAGLDLEQKSRLERILAFLNRTDGLTPFGSVTVKKIRNMFHDSDGRIYVVAEEVDAGDKGRGPGLAILQTDGSTEVLLGEQYVVGWDTPILTSSERQIWIGHSGRREPVQLLDLNNGEFIDEVANSSFGAVRAVATDGRVFVAHSEFPPGLPHNYPLMVHSPSAPDRRIPRQVATVSLGNEGNWLFAVADDGFTWACLPEQGLIRFGRGARSTIASADKGEVRFLLPGADGVMLVGGLYGLLNNRGDGGGDIVVGGANRVLRGLSAVLYNGPRQIAAGKLSDLISTHAEIIRQAFGPEQPSGKYKDAYNSPVGITADKDGNIWCLCLGELWVLIDGHWEQAKRKRFEPQFVSGVGTGKRVYISDLKPRHDGGRSNFGEVKNGMLHFEEAPHSLSEHIRLEVKDRDGELWVPSFLGRAQASSDRITGQIVYRLGDRGVLQQFENSGWGRLADDADYVWLARIRGASADNFNLWRQGEIVQTIDIPACNETTPLFSDGAGSVYAWTAVGLQHLIADPPDYDEYRLANVYSADEVFGNRTAAAYSSQGYIVATTFVDRPRRESFLHVIELSDQKPPIRAPDDPPLKWKARNRPVEEWTLRYSLVPVRRFACAAV